MILTFGNFSVAKRLDEGRTGKSGGLPKDKIMLKNFREKND